MNKEKITKILKSRLFIGLSCLIFGGALFSGTDTTEVDALSKTKIELEKSNVDLTNINSSLTTQLTELQDKLKISEIYLSLDANEKTLVDKNINDVKKAKEKAEKEATEKVEKEKKEADAKKYKTGLTFEDMARNPKQNQLKLCTFKGKILQVMKSDNYTQYRFAIGGNYDKVALIEIDNLKLADGNILENDYITIEGTFIKETSYKTVRGDERTIPAIVVDNFTRS